jgi:hypothetical protein
MQPDLPRALARTHEAGQGTHPFDLRLQAELERDCSRVRRLIDRLSDLIPGAADQAWEPSGSMTRTGDLRRAQRMTTVRAITAMDRATRR